MPLTDPLPTKPASGDLADAAEVKSKFDSIFTYLISNGVDTYEAVSIATAAIANAAVTVPKLAAQPAARVTHTIGQNVPNSPSSQVLAFNTERFDNDAIHDNATNNARLTCKTAGLYLIGVNVQWGGDQGATNHRILRIELNGATTIADDTCVAPGNTVTPRQSVVTLYQLAVNDYVQVRVSKDSTTSPLNVDVGANYSPEFWMIWQSP